MTAIEVVLLLIMLFVGLTAVSSHYALNELTKIRQLLERKDK